MNRVFVSLLIVFAAVATVMVIQATRESSTTVLTPRDLTTGEQKPRSRIRVGGRVAALPIDYQVEPNIKLSFSIVEPGGNEGTPLAVIYEGLKPDMFAPGRDVIIDGDFDGSTLRASSLLTQCPSKYEPPAPSSGATPLNVK